MLQILFNPVRQAITSSTGRAATAAASAAAAVSAARAAQATAAAAATASPSPQAQTRTLSASASASKRNLPHPSKPLDSTTPEGAALIRRFFRPVLGPLPDPHAPPIRNELHVSPRVRRAMYWVHPRPRTLEERARELEEVAREVAGGPAQRRVAPPSKPEEWIEDETLEERLERLTRHAPDKVREYAPHISKETREILRYITEDSKNEVPPM